MNANLVKNIKTCEQPSDYGVDQSNSAYCVVTCAVDEIGLFTWWEWIDVASGERVAGYSSAIQTVH